MTPSALADALQSGSIPLREADAPEKHHFKFTDRQLKQIIANGKRVGIKTPARTLAALRTKEAK